PSRPGFVPSTRARRYRPVRPSVSRQYCQGFFCSDLMSQMSDPPLVPDRGNRARDSVGGPRITIAPIALGCGNFGGIGSAPEFFGRGLTEDQSLKLMDAAWQSGIRHFDTADAYGGGRSEHAIGRWIRSRGVRPQLTTKTFNPMQAGAEHGLRPERIARQLGTSLERLRGGHVELYLAHQVDPALPPAHP